MATRQQDKVTPNPFRYMWLLTCTHTHAYGTDVITSLHYSEKAAQRHAEKVAAEHDYSPEDGETFTHEICEWQIDLRKLKERKEQ